MKKLFLVLALISANLIAQTPEEVFTDYYNTHYWVDEESLSGGGSNLTQTATLREVLPQLLQQLNVTTMLDIPCGDFHWMQDVKLDFLEQYIGADIVADMIQNNQKKFGTNKRTFKHLDLITSTLPKVDLVFCRDCLVHLQYKDIFAAIETMKKSGSKYLLATTFPQHKSNHDLTRTGDWRTLNLQAAPFYFPEPLVLINEQCTQDGGVFRDKSLGLWKLENL